MKNIIVVAAICLIFWILIQSPEKQQAPANPPQQDLSSLEHDLQHLQEILLQHSAELESISNCVSALESCKCGEKLEELEKRIAALEATRVSTSTTSTSSTTPAISSVTYSTEFCPCPPTTATNFSYPSVTVTSSPPPLRTPVRSTVAGIASRTAALLSNGPLRNKLRSYQPRWSNNDGLSFEAHARVAHGIDTRGLTYNEIGYLRDQCHDRYGPGHSHTHTSTSSNVVVQTPRSNITVSSQQCPSGGCPPSYRPASKGSGLLGFGILRRK